jgi:hypothetical protein
MISPIVAKCRCRPVAAIARRPAKWQLPGVRIRVCFTHREDYAGPLQGRRIFRRAPTANDWSRCTSTVDPSDLVTVTSYPLPETSVVTAPAVPLPTALTAAGREQAGRAGRPGDPAVAAGNRFLHGCLRDRNRPLAICDHGCRRTCRPDALGLCCRLGSSPDRRALAGSTGRHGEPGQGGQCPSRPLLPASTCRGGEATAGRVRPDGPAE